MVITYHGENYFKIQSGNLTVLIDPVNSRSFKGANIILNTLSPSIAEYDSEEVSQGFFWIERQGEYEVEDMKVRGWSIEYDKEKKIEKTAYILEIEDIKIAILGHLTKEISAETCEHFQDIDVMILPGEGKRYIEESSAAKLIRQTEPSIIIPSLFTKEPQKFFSEMSQKPEPEERLLIKKKDLSPKAMKVAYIKIPSVKS